MKVSRSEQAVAIGIIAASLFLVGLILGLGKFDSITLIALATAFTSSSALVLRPEPSTPTPTNDKAKG